MVPLESPHEGGPRLFLNSFELNLPYQPRLFNRLFKCRAWVFLYAVEILFTKLCIYICYVYHVIYVMYTMLCIYICYLFMLFEFSLPRHTTTSKIDRIELDVFKVGGFYSITAKTQEYFTQYEIPTG